MGIEYIDKKHARLVVNYGSKENRRRRVKRITYAGKKDAERQYLEFKQQLERERGIDPDLTVESMVTAYIKRFKANGGKTTTVRAYNTAKKPLVDYFKQYKAKDVTIVMVEAFIDKESKTRSPKTIKNEISLLSSAYKQAIRRGLLKSNPCEYAEKPRQQKPQINILTDEEVKIFVAALDRTVIDFKVMCELALFCGLRKSEIFGLLQGDVGETVTIDKVRHHIKKQDIIQTPKTMTSNRTLAVPKFILDDIKIMQEEQKKRPNTCEYLIQNGWGEPPAAAWCDKHIYEIRKISGLQHITMHGLRHTYASMLISNGVPISEVSAQLGHASVDITLRIYTHLFTEASTASRRISAMMEDLMAPKWHQNKEKSQQPIEITDFEAGADERIRT